MRIVPILDGGISIHAPLAGCDEERRAMKRELKDFNPRTPRGVRRASAAGSSPTQTFQSTHPSRGATAALEIPADLLLISIHAPLAGCDTKCVQEVKRQWNFNPRTPRGVRRDVVRTCCIKYLFQSTHPSRGATYRLVIDVSALEISIHAPLAGCDVCTGSAAAADRHFNPRTPRGVRRNCAHLGGCLQAFQSTHPLRGATFLIVRRGLMLFHFNPRTPCGVRRLLSGLN